MGQDHGPTPAEFVLHALVACITSGLANIAAARRVKLTEVRSTVAGDIDLNGILGLNANYINQDVKYLADRRLEELGFEPHYKVSNPAKWMATANDTLQLVNFFESTNTSYESNASASVTSR